MAKRRRKKVRRKDRLTISIRKGRVQYFKKRRDASTPRLLTIRKPVAAGSLSRVSRVRKVAPSVVVTTYRAPGQSVSTKHGGLVRTSNKDCARRKAYKKTMMKKLAAQAKSGGNLKNFRRVLRNQPVNIEYRC